MVCYKRIEINKDSAIASIEPVDSTYWYTQKPRTKIS